MSRRIRTVRAAGRPGAGTPLGAPPIETDSYFDKVVKYIPADVVGAWVAVTGIVSSAGGVPRQAILWVAFGAGLILSAWWTLKQAARGGP